ncbi:MAG: ABC transporter ATP-binding protein [Chitinophagaceae bacterium]|nr:ABC transporter ATP-binding protein [Chitinophagaceae bacterium]
MTSRLKRIIAKNFEGFVFFYRHLRHRMMAYLMINILVSLLAGFGLAMFIPLLEIANDATVVTSSSKLGNLGFILTFFQQFGIRITLESTLLIITIFFILKAFAIWLMGYMNVMYRQFFMRKVRLETITALSNFRYELFVSRDAGRIQNTMSGEIAKVVGAYGNYTAMMNQFVTIVIYIGLAVFMNPKFAIMLLVGILLTNFIYRKPYKVTKELSEKVTKIGHEYQRYLIQMVSFFKYLNSSGRLQDYSQFLKNKVLEVEAYNKRMGIIGSLLGSIREPMLIIVICVVIYVEVRLLGGNLGVILLSILFFYRALNAIISIQSVYNSYLGQSGALANFTEFSTELRQGRFQDGHIEFNRFEKAMECKQISYRYLEQENWTLQDINLTINRHETIAIVGQSGSGKTTLLSILCGLIRPETGSYWVDGKDVRTLEINSFKKRIGIISQDPVVFNDTVFNNVSFYDQDTPENRKRCEVALEKASILDFILQHPKQLNARLGNNGINLSGGQKQRIAIARELYKEVEILFFDEATSSLDTETERQIQQNIEALKGRYTIVLVAHRLSTIKHAHRIVMLKAGRIEQIAPYEELIASSDAFRHMVALQDI